MHALVSLRQVAFRIQFEILGPDLRIVAAETLLVGGLVSLVVALLYRDGLSFFTEFRATPAAFAAGVLYYAHFFRKLVQSNLRLAAIVLSPNLPVNPGIIKVRTRLKSRMGRLMLANSITLTPGTITMDIIDGEFYVHALSKKVADDLLSGEMERRVAHVYLEDEDG